MGVVSGFKGAGLFAKTALILLIIAAMCAWITYTCTGWAKASDGTHYGLWRRCSDNEYNPSCILLDGWANDWWAATQALVTFGLFGINIALFLTILYMFVPSCTRNREVAIATAIICILTGILYLIGVIVFGAEFKADYIDADSVSRDSDLGVSDSRQEFSYCFGLSFGALVFEIVAGILMILDTDKWTLTREVA